MFHILNIILFFLFLIGAAHGKWVVGSTDKIRSECNGKHLRHISIHPKDPSVFSVVCTAGAPATIWKLEQTNKLVQQLVDETKGSIQVLMPYYVSQKLRFAVIIQPNTNAGSYWYWGLSSFEANAKVRQTTGSITSFVPYHNLAGNRVYCIVATKETTTKSLVFISNSPEEINARANGGFLGGPKNYRVTSLYAIGNRLFDALLRPASMQRWFYVYGTSEANARKNVQAQGACITAATPSVNAFGTVLWAVTSELCRQPNAPGSNPEAGGGQTSPSSSSAGSGTVSTAASVSKNPEIVSPEPSMENTNPNPKPSTNTKTGSTSNTNFVSGESNSFSFSFTSRARSD